MGAAIEELYPERLAEHYEELAHHFTQGEVWAKAMEYSTLAGDRAAEAFANAEARAHYARALQAAAQVTPSLEPGAVARLHAKHGAVLTVLGEYEGAVAAYQRALELIRQTADRRGEIDILVGLSAVYRRYHREAPAIATIEQALAMARELGDRACEALCLANRAYIRSCRVWPACRNDARCRGGAAPGQGDWRPEAVSGGPDLPRQVTPVARGVRPQPRVSP